MLPDLDEETFDKIEEELEKNTDITSDEYNYNRFTYKAKSKRLKSGTPGTSDNLPAEKLENPNG
jgi:hypothetical protein